MDNWTILLQTQTRSADCNRRRLNGFDEMAPTGDGVTDGRTRQKSATSRGHHAINYWESGRNHIQCERSSDFNALRPIQPHFCGLCPLPASRIPIVPDVCPPRHYCYYY